MIDQRVIRLADAGGFMQAFNDEIKRGIHKTYVDAYESVESLRIKYFGSRKYSSYDSFRVSRKHHLTKPPKQSLTA